ncbi:MarR family winged helix-turn-helix transcriptional regulator [Paucimonas lemoignei]|nr:MarR family winged helix-turn-helix transcriptional regulator [Paucimonas lemoignei]
MALRNLRIVIRAAQRHSAWIEKQCGVSGAQLWVMKELAETSGLRIGEVAERLSVHQTTASNLVEGLCKRGLIRKQRDQADQRIVTLALTRDGNVLMKKAPSPARGFLAEAIQRMDRDGLAQLNQGLQALIVAADNGDEDLGLQLFPFMH